MRVIIMHVCAMSNEIPSISMYAFTAFAFAKQTKKSDCKIIFGERMYISIADLVLFVVET